MSTNSKISTIKPKKNLIIKDEVNSEDIQITVEEQYKKKSLHQHILDRPGMYIGPIRSDKVNMYVYNDESNGIIRKDINVVLGLYKIFDEILVNAADNTVRDNKCNRIDVNIDQEKGTIQVKNNGTSVPIEFHKDEQMYVPEMIFGTLLTSGNYNDDEERIVGGTNGLGAKLVAVYSDWFDVEIQDTIRHKKYYQRFKNNLYEREKPIITDIPKTVTDSYTMITFLPDYKRFGLNNLTDDHLSLFKRRVYDVAGTTKSNVKVYYNGEYIDVKTFEDYIKLYYSDKDEEELNIIYQDFNERWSIGVVYDPTNEFRHMTFVNKISTYDGGTHLNYIINQIVDKVTNSILSQPKHKSLKIKPAQIKDNLTVFINSTIENPVFGSQTKDALKTKISDFKVKCEIDDKFITKICKSGLLDEIVQMAQLKQFAELEKSDGKKVTNLKNLVKLEDARYAGTKQAHKCTLILTEGDSAKKFAIDAFEIIGRDYFGVFPLKGKLLNVREATASQLINNEEIKNLKQILGLQNKKVHVDIKDLRYGHMLILTDQDSVSADTSLLLKNTDNKYEIKTIDDISSEWILGANGKETSLTNFQIWTEKGWTKIVRVIRHKVTKKMYRVLTHTGVVDVTEDHSLLKPNGDEISPKDCIIDQELLHSFPKFEELKINIPDDLENIKIRDLWEICKELKIQYYQNYKKEEIIKILNDYKKNSMYIKLGTDNTIDKDEAYVMGLFFADGSCNINKWSYKHKPVNRPNEYTFNRISYCWNISNSNMDYLNKAINILRAKYQYEFKIIDDRHNHDVLGGTNMYKIIINGGEKTKPIIDKYRKLFYDKDANKCIPSQILNASYEVRENFFIGYYDGDGCKVSRVGAKYFDVNGKIGSHGLFFLCKSLGYEVSINTQERKPKVYTLNITKGTQQHHPNTIKKIIELENKEQYVYDLETENHHFQAGVGQMIVHNTDGSHIKGLLINFIHTFWPSLTKVDGFIQSIATPIVKIFKKSDSKKNALQTFYTMTEYKKWCDKIGDIKGYDIKYYKGLGTSTDKEAIDAFTDYENKIINYVWNKKQAEQQSGNYVDEEKGVEQKEVDVSDTASVRTDTHDKNEPSYQAITLAFAKKRANDRKDWLKEYDPSKIVENSNKSVSYDEFVEYDLKHFSNSDNIRSIPDISDGLKPSQRKILYGAIKRKLEKDEIKVAQLSGYISEHTGYHHGEASLQGAIINMAQDFCGSNNINVFKPNGNFGSRRVGGKDAASSRYIFTQLNKVTKLIFSDKDEPVLEYNDEEGDKVEPKIYYPIIPMILVNGTTGIGTGYSTDVPQYNPLDLIKNIRDYLNGKPYEELDELVPWYRGFSGKIEKKPKNKPRDKEAYNVYGVAPIINENTIRITELPIGVWTEPYLQFLESQREEGTFITDYINNSSNHKVDIEVIFANGQLQYLQKNNLIFSRLKLISSISIENMHLYKDNIITKYKSANAILKDYIKIRLDAYELRKKLMIKILNNEMQVLKYRKQYIEDILDKKIIVERVTRPKLVQQIIDNEYPELSINLSNSPSYDYLLSLPITALTTEKIDDINQEFKGKKDELDTYKNTSIQNLWLGELDEFEKEYEKWLSSVEITDDGAKKKNKGKITKTVKVVKDDKVGTKSIKKIEKKEEVKTVKVVKKTK
jgi:DNA gyrase/topoisomerase IV subunit B